MSCELNNNNSQLTAKTLLIMNKLEYTSPAVEIINIEVEGIIAFSKPGAEPGSKGVTVSKQAAAKSSPTMDDYNWE